MSEVKPLSLSTAIRLGAMLRPQVANGYTDDGTCALAAAAEAAGIAHRIDEVSRRPSVSYVALEDRFPILLTHRPQACPACTDWWQLRASPPAYLSELIYHLNDSHHWTREAIADFVEHIEQEQAQPQPEMVPVNVAALCD